MAEVARVEETASASLDETSRLAAEFGLSARELRPLLEGARARGLADAFELLGAGAILLDQTGAVLHLSTHARAALGGELRLAGGTLVAADGASNHIVEQLIACVLAGGACEGTLGGERSLHLRAMPAPGARDEAQLLKAVLFVSKAEPPTRFSASKAQADQACAA